MDQHEDLIEAATAARDALQELTMAIHNDREVYDGLRHGGAGWPYELRNLLPDLEGTEGGWLMGRGESFIEQLDKLVEMVEDGELTDEEIVARLEQEPDGETYLSEINDGAPASEVWNEFRHDH